MAIGEVEVLNPKKLTFEEFIKVLRELGFIQKKYH